jgi:hypothetical protein
MRVRFGLIADLVRRYSLALESDKCLIGALITAPGRIGRELSRLLVTAGNYPGKK